MVLEQRLDPVPAARRGDEQSDSRFAQLIDKAANPRPQGDTTSENHLPEAPRLGSMQVLCQSRGRICVVAS